MPYLVTPIIRTADICYFDPNWWNSIDWKESIAEQIFVVFGVDESIGKGLVARCTVVVSLVVRRLVKTVSCYCWETDAEQQYNH